MRPFEVCLLRTPQDITGILDSEDFEANILLLPFRERICFEESVVFLDFHCSSLANDRQV